MSTLQASGFAQIPPEGGIARNDTTRKFELGTVISDTYGNSYRYVKANEALAVGQVVTAVAKAAWTVTAAILADGAITGTDLVKKIHIDAGASDIGAITKNQFRGQYVSQASASGLGRGYKISHHDAIPAAGEGDIYFEDAIAEDFADNVALLIYDPYLVELIDAGTELPMGVAVGTIAASSYGFIQVGGHCPAVAVGGTTSAAVVLNEPLVAGSTVATNIAAGSLMGMAGSTEADIMEAVASPFRALQAVAANTDGYVEAFIHGLV